MWAVGVGWGTGGFCTGRWVRATKNRTGDCVQGHESVVQETERGIAYRVMSQGVQETERGDYVQGDESGSTGNRTGGLRTGRWVRKYRKQNRGIAYRELSQGVQGTEQEGSEQEDDSGDSKQNGEDLKDSAGDFVVFTHESRLFAGRIAEVKKCGSLMKPCNMCNWLQYPLCDVRGGINPTIHNSYRRTQATVKPGITDSS